MEYQVIVFILVLNFCCSQEIDNEKFGYPEPSNPPGQIPPGLSNDDCVNNIYRRCNFPTTFTDEELENVRLYLNYAFTQLADIKPDKPLCPKLHVRQDWKCLTDIQRQRVVDVWRQMYAQGIVQKLTDLHFEKWPEWHKSVEFFASHRWFVNEFEKYMIAIDSRVTLPYWMAWTYACQPERSSIWDTLGHAGNYSNGYRVPDGIYPTFNLVPAMRRHWACSGRIYPWGPLEFVSSVIQTSKTIGELATNSGGLHFQPHLCVGGYEGQYAVRIAPYDCLFHMQHTADVDIIVLSWQLLRRENLCPLSYNLLTYSFNQTTGYVQPANIYTDTISGVPGVNVKDQFFLGFGDLCYIPDRFVKPINRIWKAMQTNTTPQPDPIPAAIKRLPEWLVYKYFPIFLSGNFSAISHIFEEVGECNNRCFPISKPTFMKETEIGRRQFRAFQYDNGLDIGSQIELGEQYYYQMWLDFNRAGYCSPYVTTY